MGGVGAGAWCGVVEVIGEGEGVRLGGGVDVVGEEGVDKGLLGEGDGAVGVVAGEVNADVAADFSKFADFAELGGEVGDAVIDGGGIGASDDDVIDVEDYVEDEGGIVGDFGVDANVLDAPGEAILDEDGVEEGVPEFAGLFEAVEGFVEFNLEGFVVIGMIDLLGEVHVDDFVDGGFEIGVFDVDAFDGPVAGGCDVEDDAEGFPFRGGGEGFVVVEA